MPMASGLWIERRSRPLGNVVFGGGVFHFPSAKILPRFPSLLLEFLERAKILASYQQAPPLFGDLGFTLHPAGANRRAVVLDSQTERRERPYLRAIDGRQSQYIQFGLGSSGDERVFTLHQGREFVLQCGELFFLHPHEESAPVENPLKRKLK